MKVGASGLGPITLTPANEELTQKVAAEVKAFDPLKHFAERQLSTLDRVSQFAVIAAREAIAQSGLVFDMPLSVRTATILGTGVGGMDPDEAAGQMRVAFDNVIGGEWREVVHPAQAPLAIGNRRRTRGGI